MQWMHPLTFNLSGIQWWRNSPVPTLTELTVQWGWESTWTVKHTFGKSYEGKVVFPGGSVAKHPPTSVGDTGDTGLIPGLGRSPWEGNGNPLQYSCLGHSKDGGAWWARVHGVKSWTQLSTQAHMKGKYKVSQQSPPRELVSSGRWEKLCQKCGIQPRWDGCSRVYEAEGLETQAERWSRGNLMCIHLFPERSWNICECWYSAQYCGHHDKQETSVSVQCSGGGRSS